jgi:transcriptional regulator with XRE-family HTH domain
MRKMREIRTEKNLTLRDVSVISGVAVSTILEYENGKTKKPNKETLIKLAKALGCTLKELGEEKVQINYKSFKCLNENCPLNKNKECDNDIVLKGIAPCFEKNKVQAKMEEQYGNTKILFADRRI